MESLVIGGKKYISSKQAAEIMGYTQDYIGQLARTGKISAERVSGVWYVSEDEFAGDSSQGIVSTDRIVSTKKIDDEKTNNINASENSVNNLVKESGIVEDESSIKKDKSKITLEGIDYISSKRAAKVMGYTQDYIGQLARSGKIESRQVGRGWYIPESVVYKDKEEDSKEKTFGDIVIFNKVKVAEKSEELVDVKVQPKEEVRAAVIQEREKIAVTKEAPVSSEEEKEYYYPSFLSNSYSTDDSPLVPEPKRSREPILHKIVSKEEDVSENNVAIRRIHSKTPYVTPKQKDTYKGNNVQSITADILKPNTRELANRLQMSLAKMVTVGALVLLFTSVVTFVPSISVFSSSTGTLKTVFSLKAPKNEALRANVTTSTSRASVIESIVIVLSNLFEDEIEYKSK